MKISKVLDAADRERLLELAEDLRRRSELWSARSERSKKSWLKFIRELGASDAEYARYKRRQYEALLRLIHMDIR